MQKNNIKIDIKYLYDEANYHCKLIKKAYNTSNINTTLSNIKNYTHFTNCFDRWDITNLVRKYQIPSFDIFFALVNHLT